MKAPLSVGNVIEFVSYDRAGFAKTPAVREAGKHHTADSSLSVHHSVSLD